MAGVSVRINVGVEVVVGEGVRVTVEEGRDVQVGRGVRVIVLVVEGVGLEMDVRVNNCGTLVMVGTVV